MPRLRGGARRSRRAVRMTRYSADEASSNRRGGALAYCVYVIELRPEAMEKKAFAAKNSERREDKPCLYVGQTARTPEDRFAQHQNGIRSSRIVKEYGVRLRPRLYAKVGPFETRAGVEPHVVHSGGHAWPEDLKRLLEAVKPEKLVWVHTDARLGVGQEV